MVTYREAMKDARYSITELAKVLNISKQNLQQKVDYERSFKDYELMSFCIAVKKKPTELKIKGFNY